MLRHLQKLAFKQMRARHLLEKGYFERGNFALNKITQLQKLAFKQMRARQTRKSPHSILIVCEERFIAV